MLGATPARSIVVEDAISGVEAGRAGNFGLVIGVDREGHAGALLQHGADMIVNDLGELVQSSS
jgi:alpha,alpha-trehalose phosphorylase